VSAGVSAPAPVARGVGEVVAAALSMVGFALIPHRGIAGAVAGAACLLVVAVAMASSLRRGSDPLSALGLRGQAARVAPFSALSLALGLGAGALHRASMGIAVLPAAGPAAFLALACLIGATEELLYRGWLQGAARPLGAPAAVAIAALAHAAYKAALFALPAVAPAAAGAGDLLTIGAWTAGTGVVLGIIRERSGSVIPCVVAHAGFDAIVYGAMGHAPRWVWS
jgi:membrane protease YdiL (CAAX protease family)